MMAAMMATMMVMMMKKGMFKQIAAKSIGMRCVGPGCVWIRHRVHVLVRSHRAGEDTRRVFGIGREEFGERRFLFGDGTGESRSAAMLTEYDGLEVVAVVTVHVAATDDVVDDFVHEALECGRAMRVENDGARVKGRLEIG